MKKDCPWGKKLESSYEYGKFGKMMKIVEREIRKKCGGLLVIFIKDLGFVICWSLLQEGKQILILDCRRNKDKQFQT